MREWQALGKTSSEDNGDFNNQSSYYYYFSLT